MSVFRGIVHCRGCFSLSSYVFVVSVPANSQLNCGETPEWDVVVLRSDNFSCCPAKIVVQLGCNK